MFFLKRDQLLSRFILREMFQEGQNLILGSGTVEMVTGHQKPRILNILVVYIILMKNRVNIHQYYMRKMQKEKRDAL